MILSSSRVVERHGRELRGRAASSRARRGNRVRRMGDSGGLRLLVDGEEDAAVGGEGWGAVVGDGEDKVGDAGGRAGLAEGKPGGAARGGGDDTRRRGGGVGDGHGGGRGLGAAGFGVEEPLIAEMLAGVGVVGG